MPDLNSNQAPWTRPPIAGGQPPEILKKPQGQLGMAPYDPGLPGIYSPGPQPFTGKGNPWYLPAGATTPTEGPTPKTAAAAVAQGKQFWKQTIPTSVNLRNQMLSSLFNAMDVPVEQMYAAQGGGQAAGQRNQQLDQLRTGMAQRGLSQSGQMDEGRLGTEMSYVQNQGNAAIQARGMAQQRQTALLQQLMQVPESDLRFWEAIRQGTIPAATLFAQSQSMDAQNWGQAAKGIATAVRSVATMGAGGAAGGGAGAGGGGMFGLAGESGGFGAAGSYGMSYGGMGGAAGEYGMSFGGGMY